MYSSYLIRIRDDVAPDGVTRAEIEHVRSGIQIVVEGEAAQRLEELIEASLADARPSPAPARHAKEIP
jgi:hypothetical protein